MNVHGPSRLRAAAVAVVFSSSFLIFSLELIAAKALLPRFGGSPMLWTTAMLAYQVLLFGGYACADALSRVAPRKQATVYIALLAVAVGVAVLQLADGALPVPDPAQISRHPALSLLTVMLLTIAVPFMVLCATSPLVQHWEQRRCPDRSPYGLFAVSNIGSFLALLAYPVVVEPLLGLHRQLGWWTLLFLVTASALAALAWTVRSSPAPGGATPLRHVVRGLPWQRVLLWLLLPAVTSAFLLAATNELCQEIAVFPFLWVLPLAAYLLSFALAFRSGDRPNLLPAAAVVTLLGLSTASLGLEVPLMVHVVAMGALVFTLCLAVHRELYRLRPLAEQLTGYYLFVAAGSGVGAAAVALVAPAVFDGYREFHLTIIAIWLALVAATALLPGGCMRRGDRRQAAVLLGVVLCIGFNRVPDRWLAAHVPGWPPSFSILPRLGIVLAVTAIAWALVRHRVRADSRVWPRVLAGLVLFIAECYLVNRVYGERNESILAVRNFFGVVRVQDMHPESPRRHVRQLTHGNINHGFQYVDPELHPAATAYHSRSTGIGRLLLGLQSRRPAMRIAVTGLGAGALAAYPRAGDSITFYEINPVVSRLAHGPEAVFSFLNACEGRVNVVLGDARLSMQQELERQGSHLYDVIALDAFSSDAVPVHLLTHEAFALYLEHLAPGGVLAVNISNRYLDLEPVAADAAHRTGLHAVVIDSPGDPPLPTRSIWCLMARDKNLLETAELRNVGRRPGERHVAWTDAASSPFTLLKWWRPGYIRVIMLPAPGQDEDATPPAL